MKTNSVVIGSGAWGRALAKVFNIGDVIPARDESRKISADYIFVATEAQKLREAISRHKIAADSMLVICAKGIEQSSLKLMSEVVEEILPDNKFVILSGPNFAEEIKNNLPTATTIACFDDALGNKFIKQFAQPHLRLYLTDDVIGTQVGGAVKNVIAIAAGIAIGLNLGENARAAIITRGMAEVMRLAAAMGGRFETLIGLSGFGDMILTATSIKSRNTSFGFQLAKSGLIEITRKPDGVVEGYHTTKSVHDLAQKLKVEMPICFSVYDILYNGKDIKEAVNDLLKRPQG